MGILSSLGNFGTGLAKLVLDLVAGILMLVGTVLMIFNQWLFGGIIFFAGCCLLVLAELFGLLNLIFNKQKRQEVGILSLVFFVIGGYFLPFVFLVGYIIFPAYLWLLIIAVTGAIPVTIKLAAKVLALPFIFFK